MILVQDGCFCDYEMNIFMRLFFENDADVQVFTNLEKRGGGGEKLPVSPADAAQNGGNAKETVPSDA